MASNTAGLNKTLRAMKASGQLEEIDEALVALAKGLARAVDADPANAALWREYRAAVTSLREAGEAGGSDDDTAAFLASLRTPPVRPPMGNASLS